MNSIISQLIFSTRNIATQGFRSLPVILSSTILVLGMTQGNINLLFLFVGFAILSPLACFIINVLWELLFSNTPSWATIPTDLWKMENATAEQCSLFFSKIEIPQTMNVVPSYWLTMMAFFFTYLLLNAHNLYNKQSESKASKAAVDSRKNQTIMCMGMIVIFSIFFTIYRYSTTCEKGLGVIISWLLGAGIAHGWYTFMKNCGLGRLDDVFGISNRLLPMQSYEEPSPSMCVPVNN
jgi:hypothetical protein